MALDRRCFVFLVVVAWSARSEVGEARWPRRLDDIEKLECLAKVFEVGEDCWDVSCGFFTKEEGGDTTCDYGSDTLCCAASKDDCCVADPAKIGLVAAGGLVFVAVAVLLACACCGCCPLYAYLCCAPSRGCCLPNEDPETGGVKLVNANGGLLNLDGPMSGASAVTEKAVPMPRTPPGTPEQSEPLKAPLAPAASGAPPDDPEPIPDAPVPDGDDPPPPPGDISPVANLLCCKQNADGLGSNMTC